MFSKCQHSKAYLLIITEGQNFTWFLLFSYTVMGGKRFRLTNRKHLQAHRIGLGCITSKAKMVAPSLPSLSSKAAKANFISTLDLNKGYHQVPVSPESRAKIAFVLEGGGKYEFAFMPFSLKNAPTVFQRMMDNILRLLECAEACIDDVLVCSDSWEQHLMDIRSFLGLAGFYCKFVPGFSRLAEPLHNMLKKTMPDLLSWSEQTITVFIELKKASTTSPTSKAFTLTTDASYLGLGAVLSQKDSQGADRPIAFFSHQLKEREKRYSALEVELVGVVEACRHFLVYLLGAEFNLRTDHRALVYLDSMKNTSARLMRWALALQPFSFKAAYTKGVSNVVADALSRQCWSSTG